MTFLTDFADQAVILPLVLVITIVLLAQGWWRGAAAWVLVIGATFAVMLALKLALLACSASLGISGVHTPSGHVAAATVVTGGLAGLLLRGRRAALLLAGTAAAIIGASRLALGLHSPAEVVIGAAAGLAGTGALLLFAGTPPLRLDVRRIALVAAVVAVVFHGLHLPAEARIRSTAFRLAQLLAVCQSAEMRL